MSTTRQDLWWIGPASVVFGLSCFFIYATWAAFQGAHFYAAPYLSPFYAPVIFHDPSAVGGTTHSLLGAFPSWWPGFLPQSPAFLILAFPGAFRFTCYYYRKAYYRGFAGSPPGCSVAPLPKRGYEGETGLFLLQNLHRYALYFAMIFVFLLAYDVWLACWKDGVFGVGVGTFVLALNVVLLAGYTFGCHSVRHLVGGRTDCLTCGKNTVRFTLWKGVTILNEKHMVWAWCSLIWVGVSDIYVRLLSQNIIIEWNTWG
jgi:hypothetical protein